MSSELYEKENVPFILGLTGCAAVGPNDQSPQIKMSSDWFEKSGIGFWEILFAIASYPSQFT
jgi:hypothetical protein